MRRLAIIALTAVSIVAVALAMIAAYAVSPAGHNAIASFAERRIARAVGGDVRIGTLTGDITKRIEIGDIRFIDDGAEWARIGRVVMVWSPGALVARRIEISALAVDDAILLARPPKRERTGTFKGFELPEQLPDLVVTRITLRNLQVAGALASDPLRLDGSGAVEMGDASFSIRARLTEASRRDDIDVDLRRTSATEAPALKVRIQSAPNGAVAALLNAGGAVAVDVNGSGSTSAYQIVLDATAGAYGALRGSLRGDMEAVETLGFDLTASPGERFDKVRFDLGDEVVASGSVSLLARGVKVDLQNFGGAFGAARGVAEWRNDGRALRSATASLQAQFSPAWRPEIQGLIGDQAEARISLERKGRDYVGTASASAPMASANLKALKTDLRESISGILSATVTETSAFAAKLNSPLRVSGAVAFTAENAIELTEFEVSAGDGASFNGDAAYHFEQGRFVVEGALAASASAIADFAPTIAPRGGASGKVKASGSPGDFDLALSLSAPGFQVGGSSLPASIVSVELTKLPASPQGQISVRAVDGSLASSARVRRESTGALTFSGINHRGKDFALAGEATLNPATREGAIDLRYAGADGAEPWPGVRIAGKATAKGALSRGRADNAIEISADALRLATISLETMRLTARGPADRLALEISADAVGVQQRVRLETVRIGGVATIGDALALEFATASARVEGREARLDRPARVTFGDGIAVDRLSLRVGDKGSIDVAGVISPRRWRADAAVRNLEFSANGATLDFGLSLDTDAPIMASGSFSATSGRLGARDATLNGRYSWDGRRFEIVGGGGDSALDLDLALPLTLRRADRLSATMNGALAGSARYRGRAETIAAFLPLALQSFEGDLAFTGALGGTTGEPRVSGELSLTDGAFTEAISGLSIVDIDVASSASASSGSSSLTFTGTASGAGQTVKTISAAGKVDLSDGVTLSADIALDSARFAAGPVERVEATGSIRIAGSAEDLLISGDVGLSELQAKLVTPENLGLVDIDVVMLGANGQPAQKTGGVRRRAALRYAVRINADNRVFVSGRGLDSEWRANAQLTGTSESPVVLGAMNLNRGDLEFSGRRFDLTRGSIGFDTLAPNDPTVDLRAERETRDGTTVAVVVSGRSSALKVSLESTPTRPSEDVMALILFDKPADELSAFQSLQVADALTQLGGVGVFGGKGVAGAARDALGLDLLNLDVDQADSSASLLTVGKYVTDGLFVSASQNARGENGSLRIEYEIGQSFSVETELRQDGDQTVSGNWKKDF